MKVRADLHNHLSTLEDIGSNVFDKVINIAQKNLGAGGIIGIINAQDKGAGRYETLLRQGRKAAEDLGNAFYVKDRGIYVIRGQEVFTQGGHILVLGLNSRVTLQDYMPLDYSLEEAQENQGVIIADHPCFLDGIIAKNPETYRVHFKNGMFDGIEVHNGEAWIPHPKYYPANKKAQKIYRRLSKNFDTGAVSTSDGHSIGEIGMNYSELEKPDFSSPEKLIESLRRLIREHKDYSQDKMTNSIIPTLNHSAKTAALRLASALKIIGRVN